MLFIIASVTCLLVQVLSSYSGDSCYDGKELGSCTPLSECQHLLDEISAAGNPMPMYMRKRMQMLGCGFTDDEPLVRVCCTSASSNKPTTHEIDTIVNWVDGTKKPVTTNPNTVNDRADADRSDDPEDVTRHPNLSLLPRDCGNIDSNRVLGGNRTNLYEMPWMVVLSYDDGGESKLGCGGTLINERYVLTAAHCTETGTRMTLDHVVLGEYDIRTDPDCEVLAGNLSCAPRAVNASIEEVIAYPGYKRQSFVDDIALIRLAKPANLQLDNIGPICLPITRSLQRDNLDDLHGTVAGWGITEERIQAPVLMYVQLPIISNDECQKSYKGVRLYSRQMCAGGVRDKDSCSGDSGGPILYPGLFITGGIRYVQRGIISFGPRRCGIGGLPGVYTRISHYMKWILDNIRS